MEIVIAIIGTATAVITVALTNFFTKRNQLKIEEKKLKEEYYIEFIKAVSNSVTTNHSERSRSAFADSQNKLLLVSSADVVNRLMIFNSYITSPTENFTREQHDKLFTYLIMAMREDLFSNKRINDNYPIIHLVGLAPCNNKKQHV